MRLSVRLLLVSACATPIGVARVETQSVYRSLTASVRIVRGCAPLASVGLRPNEEILRTPRGENGH